MRLARRTEFVWVLACLAATAVWIDFSKIHRCHSSDSLVLELVSLYRWTPFYWEQDRFGMFFPLLATPWRHPLDNLLVQAGMTSFVGLSGLFLLGYYTSGPRLGVIAGAVGALYMMIFTTIEQHAEALIVNHTYLTTPALGLAGLVMFERWAGGGGRIIAPLGAGCIFVAHWINPAVAMALGPLVIVRGLCFRDLAKRLTTPAGQQMVQRRDSARAAALSIRRAAAPLAGSMLVGAGQSRRSCRAMRDRPVAGGQPVVVAHAGTPLALPLFAAGQMAGLGRQPCGTTCTAFTSALVRGREDHGIVRFGDAPAGRPVAGPCDFRCRWSWDCSWRRPCNMRS